MTKHLIVVPYRDRNSHLVYFLKNSFPLIKKHLSDIKLVVIEQNEENLFNKGALVNIAYDIYRNKADSLIVHDIDSYPNDECVKKYYTQEFEGVVGILSPPCSSLGGVFKISNKHFNEVNGFPNNFWGWGLEDQALLNRVEYRKIPIKYNLIRSEGCFEKYFVNDKTNHSSTRDHRTYKNKYMTHYQWWDGFSSSRKETLLNSSGINNLKYQIISKKITDYYDHYIVKILRPTNNRNFFEKIKNYFLYY